MTDANAGDGSESILVDRSAEVGSERLAAALAAADVPALGQALRHDYVVVPLLKTDSGEVQTRVFESENPESATPYQLCLFSSTETFALYLADNPLREFALRRGPSLIPFLTQYRDVLERVVFDPAGPYPMTASAADVLFSLQPQPGDDEVAWAASAGARSADQPSLQSVRTADDLAAIPDFPADGDPKTTRVLGLDFTLSKEWFVIELEDEKTRDEQVKRLVEQQLKRIGSAPALRAELARWLTTSCERAASAGGRFLAYLLQRNEVAALALNVAMYWHSLGPAIGDVSHLDRVTERIKGGLADGDELVGASTQAGPFIRHSRITRGAGELGAEDLQLLVVDYWLEFPDQRGLCLLSFSSPHVDIRDRLLLVMDNIVLSGVWVVDAPASDPDPKSAPRG